MLIKLLVVIISNLCLKNLYFLHHSVLNLIFKNLIVYCVYAFVSVCGYEEAKIGTMCQDKEVCTWLIAHSKLIL